MSSQHTFRPLAVAPFLVAVLWAFVSQSVASQAARGFAMVFGLQDYAMLMAAIFLLFLVLVGFTGVDCIAHRRPDLRRVLALPRRKGFAREWAVGASVGWGIVVASIVPMALGMTLRPALWWSAHSLWMTVLSLAALAMITLAEEMLFRGYPFRLLIDSIGPAWATVVMSLLFALAHPLSRDWPATSFCMAFVLGLLLAMGYLRTHALWLPWGLHFAFSASMGVLFGLPVQGGREFATLVETKAVGAEWLTGGLYGPMAATLTLIALAGGAVVLYQATRDYAWNYTHPPIVPGGYPMDMPTPAAHTAMEAAAAAQPLEQPDGLVQILPANPEEKKPS